MTELPSEADIRRKLQHRRIRELLSYNRKTGELKWRVDRSRTAKAGDLAGTVRTDGLVTVVVDGQRWLGHRLAWFYETGGLPSSRLYLVDGDGQNLKWNNIALTADRLQQTPTAIRQRQWRAARRALARRQDQLFEQRTDRTYRSGD